MYYGGQNGQGTEIYQADLGTAQRLRDSYIRGNAVEAVKMLKMYCERQERCGECVIREICVNFESGPCDWDTDSLKGEKRWDGTEI